MWPLGNTWVQRVLPNSDLLWPPHGCSIRAHVWPPVALGANSCRSWLPPWPPPSHHTTINRCLHQQQQQTHCPCEPLTHQWQGAHPFTSCCWCHAPPCATAHHGARVDVCAHMRVWRPGAQAQWQALAVHTPCCAARMRAHCACHQHQWKRACVRACTHCCPCARLHAWGRIHVCTQHTHKHHPSPLASSTHATLGMACAPHTPHRPALPARPQDPSAAHPSSPHAPTQEAGSGRWWWCSSRTSTSSSHLHDPLP